MHGYLYYTLSFKDEKIKKFISKIYILYTYMYLDQKLRLKILFDTYSISRCTDCIFSFPSRRRDATCCISQHRPRQRRRQICRSSLRGTSSFRWEFPRSRAYVYLLNLYTVSFVAENIGARSFPTFASGCPPHPSRIA